jgi:hypothetical protein
MAPVDFSFYPAILISLLDSGGASDYSLILKTDLASTKAVPQHQLWTSGKSPIYSYMPAFTTDLLAESAPVGMLAILERLGTKTNR